MNKRNIYYLTIAVAGILLFTFYFYNTHLNKSTFALEVDPTKDTTDIAGTMYRIRLTNVGLKQLTGIVVDLGKNNI
ncbi:MAG TPA: hypothetical protein VKA95_00430, partial [Nitrososphaeraceae archaeon]|nr:hypothetical protein [Nitrososphaeraceae archaeon]